MNRLQELIRLTVVDIAEHLHLEWAVGEQISLSKELAEKLGVISDNKLTLHSKLPELSRDIVQESCLRAAWISSPPSSSRLPFPYHWVPSHIRVVLAKAMGAYQKNRTSRWASYPNFPLDLTTDFLCDLVGGNTPAQSHCPVILSHDLDSKEGLDNALQFFFPIEKSYGATSSNYIVPQKWKLDWAALDELVSQGHELGVHGYDHSNKTSYVNSGEMAARLNGAKELFDRYNIKGYRAPSLVRTPELLDALTAKYQYDSSIPTSGGLFPKANNGCASARPFGVNKIKVLPLSMPRDGSLIFLGFSPDEIVSIWKECATRIAKANGVVVLLTHCEHRFSGNYKMLAAYQQILQFFSEEEQFQFATPSSVLDTNSLAFFVTE